MGVSIVQQICVAVIDQGCRTLLMSIFPPSSASNKLPTFSRYFIFHLLNILLHEFVQEYCENKSIALVSI